MSESVKMLKTLVVLELFKTRLQMYLPYYSAMACGIITVLTIATFISQLNAIPPNKDILSSFHDGVAFSPFDPLEQWNQTQMALYTIIFKPNNNYTQALERRVMKMLFNSETLSTKPTTLAPNTSLANMTSNSTENSTTLPTIEIIFQGDEPHIQWYLISISDALCYHRAIRRTAVYRSNEPLDLTQLPEMTIFLPLLYAIQTANLELIQEETGKPNNYTLLLRRMPHPPYYPDVFDEPSVEIFVARFALITFVLFYGATLEYCCDLKRHLRRMLQLWGHNDGIYQAAQFNIWMLLSISLGAITTGLMCLMPGFSGQTYIVKSDYTVIFVLFVTLYISIFAHAFFLSSWISDQKWSLPTCFVYWIGLPFIVHMTLLDPLNGGYFLTKKLIKIVSTIHPVFGLYWFLRVLSGIEHYAKGAQWTDIGKHAIDKLDNTTVFEILTACGVMAVFIYLCGSFFKIVFKIGEIETLADWEFLMNLYFRVTIPRPVLPTAIVGDEKKTVVTLTNISKSFYHTGLQKVFEITNVNFTADLGKITVILGQQNSGTSTILRIMVGIMKPDNGTISVLGIPLPQYSISVWPYLVYCEEDMLLLPELTPNEHFEFFAIFNKIPIEKSHSIKSELLANFSLNAKLNSISADLSLSEQRVLHVALHLMLAQSRGYIAVIDQPTLNMTAADQYEMWTQLQKLSRKQGLAVIISTFSTIEAETIADSVVILAHGNMVCSDSMKNLADTYGLGYLLKIYHYPFASAPEKITNQVRNIVPTAKALPQRGLPYLAISIGRQESSIVMSRLCERLISAKVWLGIIDFTITLQTLTGICMISEKSHSPELLRSVSTFERVSQAKNVALVKKFVDATMPKNPTVMNQSKALVLKSVRLTLNQLQSVLVILVIFPFLILKAGDVLENVVLSNDPKTVMYDKLEFDPNKLNGLYFISGKPPSLFSKLQSYLESTNWEQLYDLQENDVEQYVEESYEEFIKKFLFGIAFQRGNVTVWFNGQIPYSVILAIQALHTSVLRTALNNDTAAVETVLKPGCWKHSDNMLYEHVHRQLWLGMKPVDTTIIVRCNIIFYIKAIFYPIAMTSIAAGVIIPMTETMTNFKLLQLLTHTSSWLYWSATTLCNTIFALITCGAVLVVSTVIQYYSLFTLPHFLMVITTFILFCLSTLSACCVISLIVKDYMLAQFWIKFVLIITAFEYMIYFYMDEAMELAVIHKGIVTQYLAKSIIFNIPTFTLVVAITKIISNAEQLQQCDAAQQDSIFKSSICKQIAEDTEGFSILKTCCGLRNDSLLHPYSLHHGESAGHECLIMLLQFIIWMYILILLDSPTLQIWLRSLRDSYGAGNPAEQPLKGPRLVKHTTMDDDVIKERDLVNQLVKEAKTSEHALILNGFTKAKYFYRNKPIFFENISLVAKPGQMVGLIGVDPKDKALLFQSLSGQTYPSAGDAYLQDGNSLIYNTDAFMEQVAYCPSNSSLMSLLTGAETLELFVDLYGINNVQTIVHLVEDMFKLQKKMNNLVGTYTAQERRKLTLAIAMLKTPNLLLLEDPVFDFEIDECWRILRLVQGVIFETKSTCLIASRHLENYESCCHKFVLMVSGKMMVIGSQEELRYKFGAAYTIVVVPRPNQSVLPVFCDHISRAVKELFQGCDVISISTQAYVYRVGADKWSWPQVFDIMGRMKDVFQFQSFTVSTTTLTDDYKSFAKSRIGLHPFKLPYMELEAKHSTEEESYHPYIVRSPESPASPE